MQPGVIDISLQFHLSNYSCIHQVPHVISSVFSGEKLVAYGILKPSTASALPQGTVVLKYTVLGQKMESTIPFVASVGEVASIPTIHHLAAKQLLKELEDGNATAEIAKLSIESGVVCSETAFVAVDEESQMPISGPLKTYDLLTDYLSDTLGCLSDQYRGSSNSSSSNSSSEEDSDEEFEEEAGFFADELVSRNSFGSMPVRACVGASFSPSMMEREQSVPGSTLSSLVALQQANGSWSLTGALTTQLGKEQQVVEHTCPSGCPFSVWATALALSLLKVTYSSQQDEWELVAKKAESWLKNQSLPPNLSLQEILSTAQAFLQ